MKYSFRRGALTGDERIETSETSVKLFKGKGKARREIAFADIQKIYEFSNMSLWDEDGGTFETHVTQLTPKKGRGIRICSFSYIRMGPRQRQVAENNADKYLKVIHETKQRVHKANPDAVLVSGNILASILGYIVSLGGIGVIGLMIYGAFFSGKPLSKIWPLLPVGAVVTLVLVPLGFSMGKSYAPVRTPLGETMNNESGTGDEFS